MDSYTMPKKLDIPATTWYPTEHQQLTMILNQINSNLLKIIELLEKKQKG